MSFLIHGRKSNKTFIRTFGDLRTQYELSKLFKPVTNMQKDLKEGFVSVLKLIREGIKKLTKGHYTSTNSVHNCL